MQICIIENFIRRDIPLSKLSRQTLCRCHGRIPGHHGLSRTERGSTAQNLYPRLSEKGVQPTSGQFIRKYHLTSASAVQRSLSALQEKDIVTSNNGQHYIYDYFLHLWLNKRQNTSETNRQFLFISLVFFFKHYD